MADSVVKEANHTLSLLIPKFPNKNIYYQGENSIKLWLTDTKGVSISLTRFNPNYSLDDYYQNYNVALIEGDSSNKIARVVYNMDIGYDDVRFFETFEELVDELNLLKGVFEN